MKRKRIVIGAGIAGLAAFYLLFTIPKGEGEPEFQGRNLTSWLVQLDDGYRERVPVYNWDPWSITRSAEQEEAAQVIRQMGTNSLGHLLRLLSYHDSFLEARVRLLQKQSLLFPSCHRKAVLAFDALGPLAKPAVPELEKLLYRGGLHGGKEAAASLASIGPEGWAVLTQAALGTNSEASCCSIWALGSHRVSIPGTISSLAIVLTNNPMGNGSIAAWALGEIGADAEHVVPMLTAGLQSTNVGVKLGCAVGLGRFRGAASSALPALREALEGSNPNLRARAEESIKQITEDVISSKERNEETP